MCRGVLPIRYAEEVAGKTHEKLCKMRSDGCRRYVILAALCVVISARGRWNVWIHQSAKGETICDFPRSDKKKKKP